MRGLRPAGLHGDIDLWYPGANFGHVDQWLAHVNDLVEIPAKQFSHKWAFFCERVMIEVLLLQPRDGGLITRFFDGRYVLAWPRETLGDVQVGGQRLAVVSVQARKLYREHHPQIAHAYQAFLSQA
ncbi:hypothetical protein KSX_55000 [Ktedonospora formicarum]|uniref:Uncharacterized protein n=1 Tax=Ktedonospora formicarum TaxID=2778364 RepID=A0A8J3MSQ7_9CHLR|nr:hypothetical protein KSX_55000 [Ktedonospora formicarum]